MSEERRIYNSLVRTHSPEKRRPWQSAANSRFHSLALGNTVPRRVKRGSQATLTAMQPVKGPFKVYRSEFPSLSRLIAALSRTSGDARDEAFFQFHANADRAPRGKLHGLGYQTARCGVGSRVRSLHPQWSVKRRRSADAINRNSRTPYRAHGKSLLLHSNLNDV